MSAKGAMGLPGALRSSPLRYAASARYTNSLSGAMRGFSSALAPRPLRSAVSRTPNAPSHKSFRQHPQFPSILSFTRYESSSAPPGSTFKSTGSSGKSSTPASADATPELYDGVQAGARDAAPRDVPAPQPNQQGEVPAYELTFTCKPCLTRSTHRISKHGYHNGTVLITCPQCKNRHVISDHLKIFNDNSKSLEDILAEKGMGVRTGVLDPEGDIELWDDGSQTIRKKQGEAPGGNEAKA